MSNFNAGDYFNTSNIIKEVVKETDRKSQDFAQLRAEDVQPEPFQIIPKVHNLFPVKMIETNLKPLAEQYLNMFKTLPPSAGTSRSGRSVAQTDTNLHKTYQELHILLEIAAQLLHKECNFATIKDAEVWANFEGPDGFHFSHRHKGTFSGIFYIDGAADKGPIVFENQEIITSGQTLVPGAIESEMHIQPIDGDLLIWPSYVSHRIEPKVSGSQRMSISFNLF